MNTSKNNNHVMNRKKIGSVAPSTGQKKSGVNY